MGLLSNVPGKIIINSNKTSKPYCSYNINYCKQYVIFILRSICLIHSGIRICHLQIYNTTHLISYRLRCNYMQYLKKLLLVLDLPNRVG